MSPKAAVAKKSEVKAAPKSKAKAIVKAAPRTLIAMEPAIAGMNTSLMKLAEVCTVELTTPEKALLFNHVKGWRDVLEGTSDMLRERLLQVLVDHGKKVTDAGTLRTEQDGWKLEARPTRTGYDPKKVEKALRAQGIEPQKYMTPIVKFEVNEDGMTKLLAEEKFTQEELDTLKYDRSFALQRPEKIE